MHSLERAAWGTGFLLLYSFCRRPMSTDLACSMRFESGSPSHSARTGLRIYGLGLRPGGPDLALRVQGFGSCGFTVWAGGLAGLRRLRVLLIVLNFNFVELRQLHRSFMSKSSTSPQASVLRPEFKTPNPCDFPGF